MGSQCLQGTDTYDLLLSNADVLAYLVISRRQLFLFVTGRAIDRRNGDVVEAEIDAKVSAVVDGVIENPGANDAKFRHGDDRLATGE